MSALAGKPGRPFVQRYRSAVFNSSMPATARLLLLALAEFADVDGENCYPAITTVAKLAGVNEKTARRLLQSSTEDGWLNRSERQGDGKQWRQYGYRLTMPEGADMTPARSRAQAADTMPAPKARRCGHLDPKVRTLTPEGAGTMPDELALDLDKATGKTKETPNADASVSADAVVTKQKRSPKKGLTFAEFRAQPRGTEDLIPREDPVFRYAKRIGLPMRFLYLAWLAFYRQHEDSQKRQLSWRKTFHVYVEKGWLGIWFIKDGEFLLTTAGKQMDIEERATRSEDGFAGPSEDDPSDHVPRRAGEPVRPSQMPL